MRPLIEDFPSQFKGKPKIEALCACFDRQFAEIEQCFQQLLFLLDIEKAEGEQLDRIGDIVVLSRAEAGLLAAQGGVIDFDVIDDARYRKYLKYKILANTSNTTYRDIITAVKTIWDVDKVSYNENTDGPASLTVSFPYEYKPGEDILFAAASGCCRSRQQYPRGNNHQHRLLTAAGYRFFVGNPAGEDRGEERCLS